MPITVNGQTIEDDAIQAEAERMRPEFERTFSDEPQDEREQRLQQWARENAVERALLEQAARADAEPLPEEQLEQAVEQAKRRVGDDVDEAALRDDVALNLKVSRLLENAAAQAPEPTDEQVRAYYDEHQDEFHAPERVHAAHVVRHVDAHTPPEVAEAKLREAQKQLEAGEDFAKVADTNSDCQDPGGDLGWFPLGHMVEEFENTVWNMKPGETSEIFATRFGFHIVKMIEKRPAGVLPLEEVTDYARQRAQQALRDEAVEKYLDSLREAASIEEA
ncbi:MAG: peptidyl-prolyl cis-trans isomerase [Planctomycetes bacterium]|nr:peptidyl-prolyl cis-trans isomerase [Planctomycetota bacterium]